MPEITELKTVFIDHECKAHPVYLCWLNSLGGWSFWLFDRDNETKSTTRITTAYTPNIPDLETAIGTGDIIGKTATAQLQIGARINMRSMDGIRGLYESPKVQMLVNPLTWQTDGEGSTPAPKWQRVVVKRGSLIVLKTKGIELNVKLTLDLPSVNHQQE